MIFLFLFRDLNAGVWCQRFNLTKPQGEITSIDSDLDGQYENDRVYKWYIQVEEGSKIRIDVIEIDIEYGYTCEYDLLSVIDFSICTTAFTESI